MDTSAPVFITRREACDLFGIKLRTWTERERTGQVPRGRSAAIPGKPGRRMVYPLAELQKLRDELVKCYDPYPDPDHPGCYRVPIVNDKHDLQALIDAESLPIVLDRRWVWIPGRRQGQGAVCPSGHGSSKTPLRQLIMDVRGRENPVCHLNGDPFDLRRENLVVRTPSQVAARRSKFSSKAGRPCTSQYKGVSWNTKDQIWSAMIKAGGQAHSLGRFKTELAAAVAYDNAARELFGDHATLNFPNGPDPEALARANEIEAYEPPFPPPGTITRRDACRMFEVSLTTWTAWEQAGRIDCGYCVPCPDKKPGRAKVYPLDKLHRLLELYNRIGKPYPDANHPGVYRVPIRSMIHTMEALIDADDLPLIEGKNWNWTPRSNGSDGDVILSTVVRPQTPLDRVIMGAIDKDDRVMHLNHDPLDCRRCNLIVRTPAEQMYATRKMGSVSGRQYSSTFKGVSWDTERGKWLAQITRDGRYKYIGRFDTETEAAEAYDNAARELFGEHAHLNFPDDPHPEPLSRAA